MTVGEAMMWVGEQLRALDNEIDCSPPFNAKAGLSVGVEREVTKRDDLTQILQPPVLLDKIRDLLDSVGSYEVDFKVKHYPSPVPPGKRRPQPWEIELAAEETADGEDPVTALDLTVEKEGGWRKRWGRKQGDYTERLLYKVTVTVTIPRQMAPPAVRKIIKAALADGSWATSPKQRRMKRESRLFVPGERVVRGYGRGVPGEVLYFVTSWGEGPAGGARVLKVTSEKPLKYRFINVPKADKAET